MVLSRLASSVPRGEIVGELAAHEEDDETGVQKQKRLDILELEADTSGVRAVVASAVQGAVGEGAFHGVESLGFRVWGRGLRVQGAGCRV